MKIQQDKCASKSYHFSCGDSSTRSYKSVIHNANIKNAFPRADIEELPQAVLPKIHKSKSMWIHFHKHALPEAVATQTRMLPCLNWQQVKTYQRLILRS